MPFDELETITRGNEPPMATIGYEYAQTKGGRTRKADAKPRLTITIPTTLCGTSKSKLWILQIGTGADAGKIRIVGRNVAPKAKSAVEPSQHAHFFRWNFGFVPRLGEEERWAPEKRPVRKMSDEEYEIDVPKSWFEQPEGKD